MDDAATAAKRLLPMYRERLEPWMESVRPRASCAKGCSGCCRQLVGSTLAEGALIAGFLRESDGLRPEIPAMREALKRQVRIVQRLRGDSPDEYLSTGGACAFLSQSGECRVYEVRPTACRTYYVTSDPSLCGRPGGRPAVIDANQLVIRFQTEMRDEMGSDFIPASGSLQAMVLVAFEMMDRSPEDFAAWLGEEYEAL